MLSFAFSSFKFNYHQEQLDSKGIIIMRGVHRVKVCDGCMVTSFVPFFLFFPRDWQDNGAGCCEGGQEKWSSPCRLSFIVYRIITEW